MAWAKYTTHDKDGNDITNADVENRTAWYGYGNTQEEAFVNLHGQGLGVALNPEKATNPHALDLLYQGKPAELKCQKTPLFVASKRYKIDPTYAVTFNLTDALNYGPHGKAYGDLVILYWVDWVSVKMMMNDKEYTVQPLTGVWKVSFEKLDALRLTAPILWYDRRWKLPETDAAKATKLVAFEPRLQEKGITYCLRGKGGNSACSYVLSLNDMERLA